MANRVRVKWNIGAFQQIRRTPEVDAMLQEVVNDILTGVGGVEGYEGAVSRGRTRNRGTVWTAEFEAILHNEETQALLKGLANARVGS